MAKRRKAAKKTATKKRKTRTVAKRRKTAKKTSMVKRAKRRMKRAMSSMMP